MDEGQRTSVASVYAAGEPHRRRRRAELAELEGRTAGLTIAHDLARARAATPFPVSCAGGESACAPSPERCRRPTPSSRLAGLAARRHPCLPLRGGGR
ncbi:hypothetical protein [Nonomuraea dietziae]|uniref:hypothetical protein n=1 Tax=Nonomuraea dietziae TaxID=65515 RepID=UPI0031DF879A